MRVIAAILVPLLALGPACARRSWEVRLHVEGQAAAVQVEPTGSGERVEIPEAELWRSFREAGRALVAQADPLAAAERTFGVAEGSGVYRYYSRSKYLMEESLGGGLVELDVEGAGERLTRGYVEWCTGTRMGQLAGSDCLGLLGHSRTLTFHGRYAVTLVMALTSSFGPMLDSLGELANPATIAATLASAVAMYLLLWLLPEPISKVIATSITVFLIGYVGLDAFFSLTAGWEALVKAVDGATELSQLQDAARDFGEVLGPQMGQVLLLLVSRSLGKGLAAKGPPLPRFAEASAQAKRLLGVNLAAAGTGVRTVTLGAGAISISLASGAVLMVGDPPPEPGSPASPASAPAGAGRKLLAFTEDNFRENLARLTGKNPPDAHAHHVLPRQFEKQCKAAGINMHDPRYGAWWEAGAHQRAASQYNAAWRAFFGEHPLGATAEQILQFGREIAAKHGLAISF